MIKYAGQRKVASDIDKKMKDAKGRRKNEKKKTKLKKDMYYLRLTNKNKSNA